MTLESISKNLADLTEEVNAVIEEKRITMREYGDQIKDLRKKQADLAKAVKAWNKPSE